MGRKGVNGDMPGEGFIVPRMYIARVVPSRQDFVELEIRGSRGELSFSLDEILSVSFGIPRKSQGLNVGEDGARQQKIYDVDAAVVECSGTTSESSSVRFLKRNREVE